MILTTGEDVSGYSIATYLGLVSSEAVMGINLIRESLAKVADVMGGRSKGYEQEISKAKASAVQGLVESAKAMGADAVIAIRFDTDYIGGGNTSMVMSSLSGTAVKLAQKRPVPVFVVRDDTQAARPPAPPVPPPQAPGFSRGGQWPHGGGG